MHRYPGAAVESEVDVLPPASTEFPTGSRKGVPLTPTSKDQGAASRARLTVTSAPFPHLQHQLMRVFDKAPASAPRFYRDATGRPILDMREHADVSLAIWWTFGQPVVSGVFDYDELYEWQTHMADDLEEPRGLFLTDVAIDPSLQARFGIRPNVLAIRPGRRAYVVVSYVDAPSESLAVSRLRTVSELMAS